MSMDVVTISVGHCYLRTAVMSPPSARAVLHSGLKWKTWLCTLLCYCVLRSQIQHNRTFLLFIWPCHVACGILVPGPEIEPMPPAGEGQSLNHWTTRGVPCSCTFLTNISHLPHNSDNSVRDFLRYSIHLFIHPPNLLLNLLSVNHWARCLGYNSDK